MENKDIILSVKDLRVNFSTDHGYVQAVRGVSFDLYKGETLCIVGESGSGKSVTSKTIMGILAANGRIVNGSIMYEGEDLTKVSEDEFHRIRGHKIGMIFQDPLSSLNPIVRIGKQITEAMLLNGNHLKQMRDNIVANEFVAYKNAITEYNSELNKAKEAVKFLKAEKKKELERIKTIVKNETDGALYTLKLDHGLELVNIKHKYDALISDNQEDAEKVAKYKEEKEATIKEANEKYAAKKAEIIATNKARAGENKELLAKTREEFNRKIAEAKVSKAANKPELAAKYKPLIAETKAKYLEKKKVASVQVKEAKAKFKQEYAEDLAKNREMRPQVTADAKAKYDSELAALMSKFGPLFEEKKNDPNAIKQLQIEFNVKKKELKVARAKACFSVSDAAARQKYISKIKITKAEAKERALTIMREVGIPYPERRYRQYPFEFSGGMRQRIVIAIALTANPEILICDEPTTALDVTIQAQILELINRLKVERNMTVMFITHDLGVVANMADRVAVMYAGKIVEYGKEEEIFYDPKHPYTWALLSSIPDVDSKERLDAIPGTPPNLVYPPKGDAFALRSKYAMKIDFKKEPPLFKVTDTHYAATWLLDPRAPKVEMPAIVKTRIETSLAANKARLASKKAAEKGEAAPEAVEAPVEAAEAVKKPAAKKPAAKKAADKPASEKKPAAKKATAKKGGK